jgi:hypothetical protein
VEYLGCGIHYPRSNQDLRDLIVSKISDINEKIIPFFNKYQIAGVKALDYADFRKVAMLIKDKAHLTQTHPPLLFLYF